jgi:hypothetical protein
VPSIGRRVDGPGTLVTDWIPSYAARSDRPHPLYRDSFGRRLRLVGAVGGPSPSTAATTAAPSPTADAQADTKATCAEIEKMVDARMESFGEALGEMIVYKQANATSQAAKAEAEAKKELTEFADDVRDLTGKAVDTELRSDGVDAAQSIAATAADDAFFDRVKAVDDLDSLENELTKWFTPLAGYCG